MDHSTVPHRTPCGESVAAVLQELLGKEGCWKRFEVPDASNGTCSLADLRDWLALNGIESRGLRMGSSDLSQGRGIYVLHLESLPATGVVDVHERHFVVAVVVAPGQVRIIDATRSLVEQSRTTMSDVASVWSGYALQVDPPGDSSWTLSTYLVFGFFGFGIAAVGGWAIARLRHAS